MSNFHLRPPGIPHHTRIANSYRISDIGHSPPPFPTAHGPRPWAVGVAVYFRAWNWNLELGFLIEGSVRRPTLPRTTPPGSKVKGIPEGLMDMALGEYGPNEDA